MRAGRGVAVGLLLLVHNTAEDARRRVTCWAALQRIHIQGVAVAALAVVVVMMVRQLVAEWMVMSAPCG